MEARERVRRYLAGRPADRPPFVPFATALAARLEQVPVERLHEDANALTRTLLGARELFQFDAVVLEVPAETLSTTAVAAEAAKRLRVLLAERAAVVLALPGPRTATVLAGDAPGEDELERCVGQLLAAATTFELEHVDCLAVVERGDIPDDETDMLDDALTPLWNVARHYALPSLLVLAQAGPTAAGTGADAVAVWSGVEAAELARRGARRVGVPVAPGTAPPELPEGGFYTSAGDLPADAALETIHALVGATAGATVG